MIRSAADEGLVLGIIKNTMGMAENMDEEYKDLLYTLKKGSSKTKGHKFYIFDIKSMHQYPHRVFAVLALGSPLALGYIRGTNGTKYTHFSLGPHFEMDLVNKPLSS